MKLANMSNDCDGEELGTTKRPTNGAFALGLREENSDVCQLRRLLAATRLNGGIP